MRRILYVVLTVVLLVSGCGKHSAINVADLDAQTSTTLDTAINEVLTSTAVPGAIVGVWGPKGKYVRTFGVANTTTRAPMQTDFFHRIGSVTKTFTVTAVLQLVDEGKLGLDDPIAKYVDKVPNGNKITLRELARMQSGLFNYSMSLAFNRDLETDPRRRYSTQQLLDYAFAQPPNFPPGQGYEYSNTNAVLLGQVVEKVSGQTLPAFVREHITEPLGMSHTSFPDTNTLPDPHAQGYTQLTPAGPLTDSTDWSPSWASWAGAMISTLDDLRIWVPALATGALLKPATQEQRLDATAMPPVPDDIRYGLGIFDARGWIGHNGSIPGYQTLAIYSPAEQTTVVALLNTDVAKQPAQPSTLFGTAITKVISPEHVFLLENAIPQPR
ncbi:serine hydrolase domain-containing protein [Mycobacteroides franklinii]|uniref:D-alanyl-D-alanine carboxypeptidase n=1 Tax=Mycobacteroides franklinii TaxID=948102 RepID=A0A4R8QU27_9MYCO|nr:serine hydrolase domain-containing protein [Mycobacteroides franklinii]TDZ44635.1 D-alanyl-D-alanine carboxypeptidase precursor [Mycobacteroides franklinii]TDZ47475.1 D-alanyl-D-alanine carboxypeptidase precursor [Mycobacteroides franklinii]TDZ58189.1 D-alanyl-D-alanine carboxypeptidase precursor [Mycobacteroides franklinii]TDZ61233.1 D-alanyl-D-alanine carboxypeptidase precursor [Mycobacteroides franklinii]TDZ71528.1 D-alanyl-D-alanine carboxypeptidase precursor [Mycobacteroides franklinii